MLSLHPQRKGWTDLYLVLESLSSVTQSLTTDNRNCLYFIFVCGLRTLYTLNELKSSQFISTAPPPILLFSLEWNSMKGNDLHGQCLSCGHVFLDAEIFSPIFFSSSCCGIEVSWIIDIIWTIHLSFHAKRISLFLENTMSPFFMFSFSNLVVSLY